MKPDEFYTKLAVELAAKGRGRVSPNPLVGSVIVKNANIIGAGFHEFYGGPHAEINAMRQAKEDVAGATLYVNLEPCSHHGKTPPCVDAIIEKKIAKVVIGTLDNNPLVSGAGVKKLVQAGIEVKVGVLEDECIELNRFFFKYIQKKTPYVTLKLAQTLDGKIADKKRFSQWITSPSSRTEVHRMRAEYDAVLVGVNTVIKDNPQLTVRHTEGRNPYRIVLDTGLRISMKCMLLNSNEEKNLVIVTAVSSKEKTKKIMQLEKTGAEIIYLPTGVTGKFTVRAALKQLGKRGIMSVLVEGGSAVFSSCIREKLADEARVFISPKIIGDGLSAFHHTGNGMLKQADKWGLRKVERYGDDVMLDLRKE
ncbi:MAG: bifunctional diaminohydroxyphosphoribosylaminopyrimidine deaminase/5-amino-6-(5-phosphoribosylamino)uracil reductase RibD [Ignavibacteriales bacterium]|nr:bifunctional diaminohydroxyphosphoribosylaminopyrimidine deaminase/5-amino-6-(5-phosphoribosylamino)uracil reductase RibD [Ignavibacteriales bacterium]